MTHVCDCGAVYADLAGLEACQIGNHGAPPIVRTDALPPAVQQLLEHRAQEIDELHGELVNAYKRLCRHEGHLPIVDAQGRTWCELCQEELLIDDPEGWVSFERAAPEGFAIVQQYLGALVMEHSNPPDWAFPTARWLGQRQDGATHWRYVDSPGNSHP